MANWANYMSYDVLGDICYGRSFDTLEMEENRFAVKLVGMSSQFHYLNAQMPVLKKLGLDRLLFPNLRAVRQRFMAYSKSRLAERMKLGTDTDRRDFFYYLLKARDPETGQGFATQELWGESNVLLIAGGCSKPPLTVLVTLTLMLSSFRAFSSSPETLLTSPQALTQPLLPSQPASSTSSTTPPLSTASTKKYDHPSPTLKNSF